MSSLDLFETELIKVIVHRFESPINLYIEENQQIFKTILSLVLDGCNSQSIVLKLKYLRLNSSKEKKSNKNRTLK
jgi:hypothetical protein